jgi:flavin reductase (DIM6/NTAB) family NADH-FMN oxidoreductase RutF
MIDADTFRSVLGRFASGVTIVTARDDAGREHGMTARAFWSVSLQPPLVLVCVDHAASMHGLLLSHPRLASVFCHRSRRRIPAGC